MRNHFTSFLTSPVLKFKIESGITWNFCTCLSFAKALRKYLQNYFLQKSTITFKYACFFLFFSKTHEYDIATIRLTNKLYKIWLTKLVDRFLARNRCLVNNKYLFFSFYKCLNTLSTQINNFVLFFFFFLQKRSKNLFFLPENLIAESNDSV